MIGKHKRRELLDFEARESQGSNTGKLVNYKAAVKNLQVDSNSFRFYTKERRKLKIEAELKVSKSAAKICSRFEGRGVELVLSEQKFSHVTTIP